MTHGVNGLAGWLTPFLRCFSSSQVVLDTVNRKAMYVVLLVEVVDIKEQVRLRRSYARKIIGKPFKN